LNDIHQADSQEIYPSSTLWFSMLRVVKTIANDQTSIHLSIFIIFNMVQTPGIHHLSTLLKMEKCVVATRRIYIIQNGKNT